MLFKHWALVICRGSIPGFSVDKEIKGRRTLDDLLVAIRSHQYEPEVISGHVQEAFREHPAMVQHPWILKFVDKEGPLC